MESLQLQYSEIVNGLCESSSEYSLDDLSYYHVLEITCCPSTVAASTLVSSESFLETIVAKFKRIISIRLKLDRELELQSVIVPSVNTLHAKQRLLISFESTNATLIVWKQQLANEFLRLELNGAAINDPLKSFIIEFMQEALKMTGRVTTSGSNEANLTALKNHEDLDMLTVAVKQQKLEIIRELLAFPFDVNENTDHRPIDFAWESSNHDVVLELLKTNSLYPRDFDESETTQDVIQFLKISLDMHAAIESNDQTVVTGILEKNPNLRYFFNGRNVSAACWAVRCKSAATYRILSERSVTFGPDEDISNDCDYAFINDISKLNSHLARHMPEWFILSLLSRSAVPYGDPHWCQRLQLIKSAFEAVNQIPEISLVLQVIATCRKIRIFFDFKQDSIRFMDLTSRHYTRGLCVFPNHHILIAAKRLLRESTKNDTHATLSHESGHCCLQMVFKNERLPFAINDQLNLERFLKILTECRDKMQHEPIVEAVFKRYDETAHARELIVTVPDMLAFYQGNESKLVQLTSIFKGLFDFWIDVVMPEMKKALPVLQKLAKDSCEITFDELTRPMKAAILHSKVEFQAQPVELKEIADTELLKRQLTSEQIRQLTSNHEQFILNIDKKRVTVLENDLLYQDRLFIEQGFRWRSAARTFDSIMAEITQSRMFLLSDNAGAGKSTTMKRLSHQLKKKLPEYWVAYVDLKNHTTQVYEKFREFEANQVIDILIEMIAPANRLDSAICARLFETGKMVLLLDGVDEISPTFTKFFIKLIEYIKYKKNQQLIATRPHAATELMHKFKIKAYELLPFSEDQAEKYIREQLKSKGQQPAVESCMKVVKRLGIVDSPLMLHLATELFVERRLFIQNFNRFALYSAIVELKKDILAKKGDVANRDSNVDSRITIWSVHQIYALLLLFAHTICKELLCKLQLFKRWTKEKLKWSPSAIARGGFLIIGSYEHIEFSHRTFAEFFAAKFIIEIIDEALENDENELGEAEFMVRMKLALWFVKEHCMSNNRFDGVSNFVSDYMSMLPPELKLGEKYIKFLEGSENANLIEEMLDNKSCSKLVCLISNVVRLSCYNENVLRNLMLIREDRSMLFERIDSLHACANLFDVFMHSNLPNWHHLTGYGLNFKQDQLKCLSNEELEKDFLAQNEVFENGELLLEDDRETQKLNIYYNFFNFLTIADDVPIHRIKGLLRDYEHELDVFIFRSRLLIEKLFAIARKHFLESKEDFSEIVSHVADGASTNFLKHGPSKIGSKLLDNFVYFYETAEAFFESDRRLMQKSLSNNDILSFTILGKFEPMRSLYRRYFEPSEICEKLVLSFILIESKTCETSKIGAFNEFCVVMSEFTQIFQYVLIYSCRLENILRFANAYISASNEKPCYLQKALERSWKIDHDKIRQTAHFTFPIYDAPSHVDDLLEYQTEERKMRSLRFYFIIQYHLLCLLCQPEIPLKYVESFFSNNLGQILEFTLKSANILVDKMIETLKLLKNGAHFAETLKSGIQSLADSNRFFELGTSRLKKSVFQYLCEELKGLLDPPLLGEVLQIICMQEMIQPLLISAINSQNPSNMSVFKDHLSTKEIRSIVLKHINKILYLDYPVVPENFASFFQEISSHAEIVLEQTQFDFKLSPYDCDEYECDEPKENSCKVYFQLLNFITQNNIPQPDLESFFNASLSFIFTIVFRSQSINEKVFEIFEKHFKQEPTIVAEWIRIGLNQTDFYDTYYDDYEWITNHCLSFIELFWFKVEDFFESEYEMMRAVLLGDFLRNHPLILSIVYGIDILKRLYFKYCNSHEILSVLTASVGVMLEHTFHSEDFEEFFNDYFLSTKSGRADLKDFLENASTSDAIHHTSSTQGALRVNKNTEKFRELLRRLENEVRNEECNQ